MKKMLSLFLALSLVFALAGCSNTASGDAASPSPDASAPAWDSRSKG